MQAALKPLRLVKNEPAGELETLFQTHHGRVFRTAQRITGSAADAEDVLQTVFLRLVKGQESYDLSKNPEAYLSRAAINASLDLLRSRTRSKSVALDEADADTIAGRSPSPEALHADRELQTLVRQAVRPVPKHCTPIENCKPSCARPSRGWVRLPEKCLFFATTKV